MRIVLLFGFIYSRANAIESLLIKNGYLNDTKSMFWNDVIRHQKVGDIIIFISPSLPYKAGEFFRTFMYAKPDAFNADYMSKVQEAIVEANSQSLILIDGTAMDEDHVKTIIEIIRKYNKNCPVMVYSKTALEITYNIYLAHVFSDDVIKIFEVCAYCNNGNDSMSEMNSWSINRKFKFPLSFPSSFKGSFNGYNLVLGCYPTLGICSPVGKDAQGNAIWGGMDYTIVKYIGDVMSFKITGRTIDKYGTVVNGTPTGLLAMVANGEADVGGGGLLMVPGREKFISYSAPMGEYNYIIITDKPPKQVTAFSLLKPFRPVVWALIALFIPIMSLTLDYIDRWSVRMTHDVQKHTSFFKYLWEIFKVLLCDISAVSTVNGKIKFLLGTWMLVTNVLVNLYFGSLTSFMTSEPFLWEPINSMEQFNNSQLLWLAVDGTKLHSYYNNDARMLKKRVTIPLTSMADNLQISLKKMLDNPNTYGLIFSDVASKANIAFYFADTAGNHGFHFSSKRVFASGTYLFLQKSSIYLQEFNLAMMRLWESGIMNHYVDEAVEAYYMQARRFAKYMGRFPKPEESKNIKVKHMWRILWIIGGLYGVALLVLLWEIFFYRCGRSIAFLNYY